MTHRFLRVDFPVDPLDGALVKTAERTVDGVRRYYYAGAGAQRILIVMRNGQPIESLDRPDAYVKALIGWDPGTADFVLPQHEGKQHTKITVDMVLGPAAAALAAEAAGLKVESLAHILANAPRADRRGGSLPGAGRPQIGGDIGTKSRPVTLLPEQWEKAWRVGGGNYSAGIRKMIDAYPEDDNAEA